MTDAPRDRIAPARISIRAATPEDAGLIAELGARTFFDTFAADNTEADMAAYLEGAFSEEAQRSEIQDPASTFLLAQVDGVPAAYARLMTGDAPSCVPAARPVEIRRFYADAPWIGAGVGSALMEACLAAADSRGHDAVWLDVWSLNPRAIAFYAKWGFSVVGEQEFVLGDDIQHDFLMARRLP